ncbi:hypothetical protein ACTXT7_011417 [Hymenolepis weldensis]
MREWKGSELFLRRALCLVNMQFLGKRNKFFIAICALPINMLNEKLYISKVSFLTRLLTISQDATRSMVDKDDGDLRWLPSRLQTV